MPCVLHDQTQVELIRKSDCGLDVLGISCVHDIGWMVAQIARSGGVAAGTAVTSVLSPPWILYQHGTGVIGTGYESGAGSLAEVSAKVAPSFDQGLDKISLNTPPQRGPVTWSWVVRITRVLTLSGSGLKSVHVPLLPAWLDWRLAWQTQPTSRVESW